MTDKKVNYTQAQTDEMVERYEACGTGPENEAERLACVEAIAQDFGRNVKSVRQKLVREGVYIAKVYKSKSGEKPESKAAIVADIACALGVASESVGSLEKANKAALTLVRGTLAKAKEALDS